MRTKCSFLLSIFFILPLALAQLRNGFYSTSCPRAESTIFDVVQRRFAVDKSITAALLRMYFHDCFGGCDASILIETKDPGNPCERDASPNLTVRGYDLIDEAKDELKKIKCDTIVSCADIIAIATRDAVGLADGPRYPIPTGRLDSLRSKASDVNLPGTTMAVPEILGMFRNKGFNINETVALLGGHTVGKVHCNFFQDRLSRFQTNGAAAADMDQAFGQELSRTCQPSSGNNDPTTDLDHGSPVIFDNQYYNQTRFKRGVLKIDQDLALHPSTAAIVNQFANNPEEFKQSFANVMIKLGGIQVLVGNEGEVRQSCKAFNRGNAQNLNMGNGQKPNNDANNQRPRSIFDMLPGANN